MLLLLLLLLLLHGDKKDFCVLRWKKHGFQITFC
jgi:hypothetical protein